MKERASSLSGPILGKGGRRGHFIVALIAVFLTPTIVRAALTPIGGEIRVNTTESGYLGPPAVAVDAKGGSVVVWATEGVLGAIDPDEVFGQRFDSAGAALGTEFRVSTEASEITAGPEVAMAPSGCFVVVWVRDDRVLGRRYDSAGAALGEQFEPSDNDVSDRPAVAMDSARGFTVVWQGYDLISPSERGPTGVFARSYDQAGNVLGSTIQVNDEPAAAIASPRIAADPQGGFAVAWHQPAPDGAGEDILLEDIVFRRFDADGMPLATAAQVNPVGVTTARSLAPAVVAVHAGGFVIAWWGGTWTFPGPFIIPQLFAQRYDGAGQASGTPISLLELPRTPFGFVGLGEPIFAEDPFGGFAIVFASYGVPASEDVPPSDVYAYRYDVSGSPVGALQVDRAYSAETPAAAADSNGVLTVVWSGREDILARRYSLPPTTADESCTGDCDCNHAVTIEELITGVGLAVDNQASRFSSCPAFDLNNDGQVTVDELVAGVMNALSGCLGATPTATPVATDTPPG
jgi:hypothetical protein